MDQRFAANLRKLREERGLTQNELATALQMSVSLISMYESGQREPSRDKLESIGDYFNVSLDRLLGRDGDLRGFRITNAEKAHLTKLRALDASGRRVVDAVLDLAYSHAIGRAGRPATEPCEVKLYPFPVSAGRGFQLENEEPEIIDVPLTPESHNADFALTVSGDSMEPDYQDGDLILVRGTPELEPGDLGIFRLNGEGFFKRLGDGELISLNPNYPPRDVHEYDDFAVIGKVLGKTTRIFPADA